MIAIQEKKSFNEVHSETNLAKNSFLFLGQINPL